MKICTAEEMRNADRRASEDYGIPGIILMETAAFSCIGTLENSFGNLSGLTVAVFCGKGNNGGDGFAIARMLIRLGCIVTVYPVCGRDFSGDAQINFEILQKTGCRILEVPENLDVLLPSYDLVIDAIFGTGMRGEVRAPAYDIIEEINRYGKYILSVDIPSGLNADTGEICGTCIHAHETVTFAAYKRGMVLFPGCEYCGKITVADIGIPQAVLSDVPVNIITKDFVRHHFPKRYANSQKGDYGKVFIAGGSTGMTGAAVLSSESALKAGSGLVTLGSCKSLNPILEEKLTEVMTVPLEEEQGQLSKEAATQIFPYLERADAALLGPGLGRSRGICELIRRITSQSSIPLILDADALNALSEDMEMLDDCTCNLILTPHAVEMSRLTGMDVSYIENNRLEVSSQFAQEYGLTLILKGNHTVVTAPDGIQYVNLTGNPGMATGGSGDVLAGLCVSLAARGVGEAEAAAMAVYIHGLAGDLCAADMGMEGVTATGILSYIPQAIRKILS